MADYIREFNNAVLNEHRHAIMMKMRDYVVKSGMLYDLKLYLDSNSLGDIAFVVVLVKCRIEGIKCYVGPLLTKDTFYMLISYLNSRNKYVREVTQLMLFDLMIRNKLDESETYELKKQALTVKCQESVSWKYSIMIDKPIVNRDSFLGCVFGMLVGNAIGLVIDGESDEKCAMYANAFIRKGKVPPSAMNFYRFGQITEDCANVLKFYERMVANGGKIDSSVIRMNNGMHDLVLGQLGSLMIKTNPGMICEVIRRASSFITMDTLFSMLFSKSTKISIATRDLPFCANEFRRLIAHNNKIIDCFCKNPNSYKDCISDVICLGGKNIAVNCAMAGALSGARQGLERIPSVWSYAVHDMIDYNFENICDILDKAFELINVNAIKIKF